MYLKQDRVISTSHYSRVFLEYFHLRIKMIFFALGLAEGLAKHGISIATL